MIIFQKLFVGTKAVVHLNVEKSIQISDGKPDFMITSFAMQNHFIPFKINKKHAQKRAKEATQGIIEAIKWLDDMDVVIVVLDATENPYSQVNITIVGNLVARKIPVLIVANKIDLKKADIKKIEAAFPDFDVVGISARFGKNMDEFYESLFKLAKRAE